MYHPQPPTGGPAGTAANTSGMGRASTVPAEIDRWNWGAFLLNIFWGIGNSTWIALLMLLPVANWIMPFVLGAKGSAWAWRNKYWRDVAHFRRVQRRWAIAGMVLWGFWILAVALAAVLPFALRDAAIEHPVSGLAFTAVRTSPEATTLLGTPIQRMKGAQVTASSQPGEAYLTRFMVSGPQGSALVEAQGRKKRDGWDLERVVVKPNSGGPPLVLLPRQRL